jgi:hypothetical protein
MEVFFCVKIDKGGVRKIPRFENAGKFYIAEKLIRVSKGKF